MKTRTGNFPIGFRQVNTNWNRDIPSLIQWAVENKLEAIDLTTDPESALEAVSAAGLRIGSIDLPDNRGMIAADPARRAEALALNTDCIRACTAAGPQNFFAVMLPEDPALPRRQNYDYMVESFAALAAVLGRKRLPTTSSKAGPAPAPSAAPPKPIAPSSATSPHPP